MGGPSSGDISNNDRRESLVLEIEEIGWEHLVSSEADLSNLTFRIMDSKNQIHYVEISLPKDYPKHAPFMYTEVPVCKLQWSKSSRLKDAIKQFIEHVESFGNLFSALNDIDQNLWVDHSKGLQLGMSSRMINVGNNCQLVLSLDLQKPTSFPDCRFLGPDAMVNFLQSNWKKNSKRWSSEKPIPQNLMNLLDIKLPGAPALDVKNDDDTECGICYARCLPIEEELGVHSGRSSDYKCDNSSCGRSFHSLCLRDWLRSISTTRQSFDVLFGNCPYCSEPVAVKLISE